METKDIIIFEQVGGTAAVATEDGEKLFKVITPLLGKEVVVTIDFMNIDTMTSTFLNAAIGQLYSKYDSPFLRKHLKIRNLSPDDLALMRKVVERAKEYFKNKKQIEKSVKEAMDGQ